MYCKCAEPKNKTETETKNQNKPFTKYNTKNKYRSRIKLFHPQL